MKRKISSYDIARHAGVSQTTVSFVLNGRMDMPISPATRERVLEVARELGYRPNRSARAVQSGRFGCVALLSSTDGPRSVLLESLRDGILDALSEHNLQLLMARLSDEALTDEKLVPTLLREWSADGILINYNSLVPPEMERLIGQYQLPSVWINLMRESDCVYPDDRAIGRMGTEKLLALGHRRVAYIHWTGVVHYSAEEREAGYREAMAAAGLPPEVISPKGGLIALDDANALLARPDRPTAVFAYDVTIVNRLMYAASHRGLSVPHDLSLVTVADRVMDPLGVRVDCLLLPEREMGRTAVEMLLARLESPATPLAPRALPCTYGAGGTTAPPAPIVR